MNKVLDWTGDRLHARWAVSLLGSLMINAAIFGGLAYVNARYETAVELGVVQAACSHSIEARLADF